MKDKRLARTIGVVLYVLVLNHISSVYIVGIGYMLLAVYTYFPKE